MRSIRPGVFVYVLLLVASVLVAPEPFHVVSQDAAAQASSNTVEMRGNSFVPPSIRVLKGTTVTWINQDQVLHSVTSEEGQPEEFDHDPVGPAALAPSGLNRATVQFNTAGVVAYFCNKHAGMVGTVEVVSSFQLPVITIEARDDNTFQPDYIEFNQSQNLSWTNVGDNTHNVVFEDAAIGKVGELPAGASVNYTLEANGSFRYRCEYHSRNFEEGMVGKVISLNTTPTFPPTVVIAIPIEGETVQGTVNVTGTAQRGEGGANVTAVEVRIGEGDWQPATLEGSAWTFEWDTTTAADGNATLDARALAGDVEGDIATVGVEVDNVAGGGNGATNQTTDEGDDTPSPALPLVGMGVLVAALAWRRRRQ